MLTAVLRGVSPHIEQCQLTYMERQAIDYEKACRQHRDYQKCFESFGINVIALPAEAGFPDGVFVEDTAVVLDEVAVICVPARPSRRNEIHALAHLLERYRLLMFLRDSATLEGGDVIRDGKTCFVGISGRTNREGVQQLREILGSFNYEVKVVPVEGCLHLSTGASSLGGKTILANPKWVNVSAFTGYEIIPVPPAEPWAANLVRIGKDVLMPDTFPETRALLEDRGFIVHATNISEFMKAEAGVTCMSLIFESQPNSTRISIGEYANVDTSIRECIVTEGQRSGESGP